MDAKKRYTLYRFPSLYGSPMEFDSFLAMWLYVQWKIFWGSQLVYEYRDNSTGQYRAYWQ